MLNNGYNALYHNDGGTGFTNVAAAAGVDDDSRGTSAAWGDYDGDGLLDLYVSNFNCGSCVLGSMDVLYHNEGDGTFTDVRTALPGLGSRPVEATFVASFLDYDNDGDLDIYAVYDHEIGNDLWRNDGPGCDPWCFTRVSESAGADTRVDGMGLAIGDYDADGDLDLYFTHTGPFAVLLQNQTSQGSPTFVDATAAANLVTTGVGWGAAFFDYDNDGWLDLYATKSLGTGHTNLLYQNTGYGAFADVSDGSGVDDAGDGRGMAYADYDEDGWVDLVYCNQADSYHLCRNLGTVGAGNSWLSLELVGDPAVGVSRDAIGARAYVYTDDDRVQMQEVKSGSSQGAGNQLRLHFGLATANIDRVCVAWPNGETECATSVTPNQVLTWSQGSYPTGAGEFGAASGPRLGQNAPNPLNPRTTIRFELDAPGFVDLRIYDAQGRAVRQLVSEMRPAGAHEVSWSGKDDRGRAVASGVYVYELRSGTRSEVRKMVLVR